jgi:hypothetical protein
MTRLILHIGKEKTGTTYIQNQIASNRTELEGLGLVDAGHDFGSADHCWITVFGYDEHQIDDVTRNLLLNDCSGFLRNLKIKSRRNDLDNFARGHSAKTVIASSEHMSSRLTSMKHLERLRGALSSIFDEITILLYLRDPLETAISLWSTALKSGSKLTEFPRPSNHYWNNCCNHKKTVEVWSETFGLNNIRPRIYEFACNRSSGLFGDFMDACNVPFPFTLRSMTRRGGKANKRLTLPAMRVLGKINEEFEELMLNSQFRNLRGRVISMLQDECSDLQGYLPSGEIVYEYRSVFLESNEWIQRNFFNDGDPLPWGMPCDSCDGEGRESKEIEDALFHKYLKWINSQLSELV